MRAGHTAGVEEAGVEAVKDTDADGLVAARRRRGDMAALTGGTGLRYNEFATGSRRGGSGYQGDKANAAARKFLQLGKKR